jgi:hypothetical protein
MKQKLKKVMDISWEIQRKKKCTRFKSLISAWAITQNEDITVYHLIKKHSHDRYPNKVQGSNLTLFNS